jgi:hypothetical protein
MYGEAPDFFKNPRNYVPVVGSHSKIDECAHESLFEWQPQHNCSRLRNWFTGKTEKPRFVFEGDDSILSVEKGLTKEHVGLIVELWGRLGFPMTPASTVESDEWAILPFTGFDFLCYNGRVTETVAPEYKRTFNKLSYTACPLLPQLKEQGKIAEYNAVAYAMNMGKAVLYASTCPLLASLAMRIAQQFNDRSKLTVREIRGSEHQDVNWLRFMLMPSVSDDTDIGDAFMASYSEQFQKGMNLMEHSNGYWTIKKLQLGSPSKHGEIDNEKFLVHEAVSAGLPGTGSPLTKLHRWGLPQRFIA